MRYWHGDPVYYIHVYVCVSLTPTDNKTPITPILGQTKKLSKKYLVQQHVKKTCKKGSEGDW